MTSRNITEEQAREQRDEGIRRVEAGAEVEWKDTAWNILIGYLRVHPDFFVDDLWKRTNLPWPQEARAIGPIILRAARSGYIVKTGEYRPSVRSNMSIKPVWKSLIYEGNR